jgi:hypothetical protein
MMSVAIKGMAGVEHRQPDGSFVAYVPEEPAIPIRAGDRLRVRLEVADDVWIYAVSARQQAEYWKLGVWAPERRVSGGVRLLWPGGRELSAEDAAMTTLLVVAAREELPWLGELTRADCTALVGKRPPEPPVTACDRLYGLFWHIPGRVRGLIPPTIDHFQDGAVRVSAIVTHHSGAPYIAIEWPFQPRT